MDTKSPYVIFLAKRIINGQANCEPVGVQLGRDPYDALEMAKYRWPYYHLAIVDWAKVSPNVRMMALENDLLDLMPEVCDRSKL